MKPDAVGVHLEMAPWTVDAGYRRIWWGHLPTRGIGGGPARVQRRRRGLVMARRERRPGLLDRFDGLLRTADAPDLEVPEQRQGAGHHDHDSENDQERRPAPQPGVE